ncbi:YceI family protein [Paractinoplanes lichenicola]|uniref:YceI family protein n=1 Tax=Paractinoplanes lichenicola TaxID=2802976 RepID=A0ABS1VIC8_9ACTN|nr:YceI family protein [Actinoplanes lichenicola]MBL7254368.1 YceI family protein [Actinoplanes lichenicola]
MTTPLRTTLRPGTYTLDPRRSTCRLDATHVFGLKPVAATVDLRGGTVTVAGDLAASTASAVLDAGTFHSDDERRDRDIIGKRFLDAEQHPAIAFRSTGCRREESGWLIDGILRVRGRDSEVTLRLSTAESTADGCHFVATATIDRVAAGVGTGRAIIARTVRLTLDMWAA